MNSDRQAKLLAHGSVMISAPLAREFIGGELYALMRTRNP
jgi:hypothetical protein